MLKKSIFFVIFVVLFLCIGGSCVNRFITRTPIPEKEMQGRTNNTGGWYKPVSCYANQKSCIESHYYLCVAVSGNCLCSNVSKSYESTCGIGRGSHKCTKSKIVRECSVTEVEINLPNVETLIGRSIPYMVLLDALTCSTEWNSYTGYKNGTLWVYIKEKDGACKNTQPSE